MTLFGRTERWRYYYVFVITFLHDSESDVIITLRLYEWRYLDELNDDVIITSW